MIGYLSGILRGKTPPSLLIDVGGVGYELDAPMTTFYDLPNLGDNVVLYTHLVVREDAHQLYGFAAEAERALFRTLIKITGVGPRLALTLLSGLNAEQFHSVIHQGDVTALVRLPGVGKKTAERLIIELKDRLPKSTVASLGATPSTPAALSDNQAQTEALGALSALGYKAQEAERLLQAVPDKAGKSAETLIRLALTGALQ
ncbi:MAG: Holliday junction branch migration protein RuvA [Methylococcales bacterium]|nr:Holliday junction branch migration protein RuvA [Methylococcales bacterium]